MIDTLVRRVLKQGTKKNRKGAKRNKATEKTLTWGGGERDAGVQRSLNQNKEGTHQRLHICFRQFA